MPEQLPAAYGAIIGQVPWPAALYLLGEASMRGLVGSHAMLSAMRAVDGAGQAEVRVPGAAWRLLLVRCVAMWSLAGAVACGRHLGRISSHHHVREQSD
jgi:hypothetical protein